MFVDEPYFMTDENWYRFDAELGKYVLTEDAPESAKVSYREFYGELEAEAGKDTR